MRCNIIVALADVQTVNKSLGGPLSEPTLLPQKYICIGCYMLVRIDVRPRNFQCASDTTNSGKSIAGRS